MGHRRSDTSLAASDRTPSISGHSIVAQWEDGSTPVPCPPSGAQGPQFSFADSKQGAAEQRRNDQCRQSEQRQGDCVCDDAGPGCSKAKSGNTARRKWKAHDPPGNAEWTAKRKDAINGLAMWNSVLPNAQLFVYTRTLDARPFFRTGIGASGMSNDKPGEAISKKVQITLTDHQKAEIAKVFGPEMAKKVESVLVAQTGAGLQSMVVVN